MASGVSAAMAATVPAQPGAATVLPGRPLRVADASGARSSCPAGRSGRWARWSRARVSRSRRVRAAGVSYRSGRCLRTSRSRPSWRVIARVSG